MRRSESYRYLSSQDALDAFNQMSKMKIGKYKKSITFFDFGLKTEIAQDPRL